MSPDVVKPSTPLRVQVLFHPASQRARSIADHLFDLLNGQSTDWGPRIPIRFGLTDENGRPTGPPTLDSHHSLVIILVDARLSRAATATDRATRDAWVGLVETLFDSYPPGASSVCSVLPVALDDAAFTLSEQLDRRSFVRLLTDDLRHLDFHVAISCLRLLQGKAASETGDVQTMPEAEVELFMSHAKRDLPREEWRGAVAAVFAARRSVPLKGWCDSSDIRPGTHFAQEIDQAVRRASAVIAILTDNYSSREWCRREILAAKAAGRPIVVVDAIRSQVVRLFPYIGNAPTVRWRAALARAAGSDLGATPQGAVEVMEAEDASTVLLVTLMEALRYRHETARLRLSAAQSDVVFGTPPEVVTVSATPDGTTRILYPDPPLGREELVWVTKARPHLDLVTPLESQAVLAAPSGFPLVGLSLSGSPDAHQFGGSQRHLAAMAHDLALYLLFNGYRLLYGGVLGHGALDKGGCAPGDDVNYVERLMELVERYSPLARDAGRRLQPIENWVAWPMYERLTEEDRNLYQENRATLEEVPPPNDVLDLVKEIRRQGGQSSVSATDRYMWGRCLTKMREDSTAEAVARVALGGKLDGYLGHIPGVVEEALLTLRAGKPLYLLGAYGGATRVVLDALLGVERVELTTQWCTEHVRNWPDLIREYEARGHPVMTPEQVADELRSRGRGGLQACLTNGLTGEQNDELAETTDGRRTVELLLSGLHAALKIES